MSLMRCDHRPVNVIENETATKCLSYMKDAHWIAVYATLARDDTVTSIAFSDRYMSVWVANFPYCAGVLLRNSDVQKVIFGGQAIPASNKVDLATEIALYTGTDAPETIEDAERIMVPFQPWDTDIDDRCPSCQAMRIHRLYKELLDRQGEGM